MDTGFFHGSVRNRDFLEEYICEQESKMQINTIEKKMEIPSTGPVLFCPGIPVSVLLTLLVNNNKSMHPIFIWFSLQYTIYGRCDSKSSDNRRRDQ